MRRWCLVAAFVASLVLQGHAQSDRKPATFDVAAIKQNTSGFRTPGVFRFEADGSLRVVNMPLRDVIRAAYALQGYQMDGWPRWLSSEFFDIQAKTGERPNQEQRLLMLRALLQTRFKLAVHRQTRRGDTYELSTVRADRRPGPALKLSVADCDALRAKLPPAQLPPPPNAPLIVCGIRSLPGRVFALGTSIDTLAASLSEIVGRPVIDQTQLAGAFDFDVRYTPDPMPARDALPPDSAPIDSNGPSIFTAVREQLGLRLDARTRPIETIVIDHVERPTPN